MLEIKYFASLSSAVPYVLKLQKSVTLNREQLISWEEHKCSNIYKVIRKHELGIILVCNLICYLLVGHRGERRQYRGALWDLMVWWQLNPSYQWVRYVAAGTASISKAGCLFVKTISDCRLFQELIHFWISRCVKSMSDVLYLESGECYLWTK